MPDVFLSYARRDSADFVRKLTTALEGEGIDVWVDLEDIPAASDWQQDLRDGVLQSDCFCFVVSPTSAASRYCLDELSDAESRNKRVIPLIHEPVAEADLPRLLQRLNWVPQRGKFEDEFDANLKVLADAIRTDLEATRAHTRWEAAAAEWATKDRDGSLLPRGSELREAESWIATQTGRDPAPTTLQAEFVEAARRASERRRRLIFGATAAALVVSIALGIAALLQRNEARDQRDNAISNELASASSANLDTDPELSIILGKEAVETVDTPRAQQALSQAISTSLVRTRLPDPNRKAIGSASFSPDGKWVATAGHGGIELWDAKSGEAVRPLSEGSFFDMAFTPDSKRVAAVGDAGAIEVIDIDDGTRVANIDTGASTLYSVDVSPDGTRVAAAGADGFAASYAIDGGDGVAFHGYSDGEHVNSIAFSPSSAVLLTSGTDDSARLWTVDDAKQLLAIKVKRDKVAPHIPAPGSPFSDAEFSPDGKAIATANVDGTATLWALDQGDKPVPTPISTEADGFASDVSFDPQRGAVLTAGIQVADAWDLDTGARIASYPGHAGYVTQIEPSPDGDHLVTAGQDGTARIWDFDQISFTGGTPILVFDVDFDDQGKRLAFSGVPGIIDLATEKATQVPYKSALVAIAHLAFDPTGDLLAMADIHGLVRIVDPVTGDAKGPTIDPPGNSVDQVQWSADGTRLMVRSVALTGGGVFVYDTASGEEIGSVPGVIIAAALSPDGHRVAYFGQATKADLSVRIVDIEMGATALSLIGHNSNVESIAYDGDGSKIVTGSDDASARVWDADTGEQLVRLDNQGIAVRKVAFSHDGNFVAVSGEGLAAFDADTGRELMRVPGFDDEIDFSPDARLIAAIGPGDDKVSIVPCDVCVDDVDSLLALADQRITREPTAAEREEFLDR
jgi:WD40 repeat protein